MKKTNPQPLNELQAAADGVDSFELSEMESKPDAIWDPSFEDASFDQADFDSPDFDTFEDPDPVEVADSLPSPQQIGLLLSALSESESETTQEPGSVDTPTGSSESELESESFVTLDAGGDSVAMEELAKDPELRDAFLNDALNALACMEQSALHAETEEDKSDAIQQFCRELHTLKGASASVGLSDLASYLHDLETSLEKVFDGAQDDFQVEPMFAAVDRVRQQVGKINGDSQAEPEASPSRLENPERPSQDFAGFGNNDDSSIRIRAAKLDRLMDMLAELVVLRNRRESHVSEYNELNDELTRCATRLQFAEEQPVLQEVSELGSGRYFARNGSQTISEIAKDITAVAQGLGELQQPVSVDNQSISRFIRDFRQELMQLRRVPVSGLFQRLRRSVRDAANAESKQVQLEILGEGTGLEQEIQERLYEPLLHIVRNAVSHGIELPEVREKAGKNGTGTVTVEAYSTAQRLEIEVRDDGGGIDYNAIRNRAIDKGLIAVNQPLTDAELGKLIFHPGFSTRQQASEVSGRGVGMDIVATTIDQLRGRVDVESELGRGTTLRITIPLRTGIEHVMVFRAAGQLFALPMQAVQAAQAAHLNRQTATTISLKDVLSLNQDRDVTSEDILILKAAAHRSSERSPQVSPGLRLAVDEIVGPEEVVVRGLPAPLQRHPLFRGVTLSGAGEMVLLLDGQEVETFCQRHAGSLSYDSPLDSPQNSTDEAQRALVVDDSLTARKVLVKHLNGMGISTLEAGDGLEALERLRRDEFDFVFTDLDMPRLGGLELLNDIQAEKYTNAPVVVVSSRNDEEVQSRVMDLGAAAYLIKPIETETFSRLMEELQIKATQ